MTDPTTTLTDTEQDAILARVRMNWPFEEDADTADEIRDIADGVAVEVGRILVARAKGTGPGWFWTQTEWAEWSNDLANLIPEDDVSRYANPDGAQESIILACLRAYVRARAEDTGLRNELRAAAYRDAADAIAIPLEDQDPTNWGSVREWLLTLAVSGSDRADALAESSETR